ncbi:MAG: hypothetical protein V8R91_07145 [Butyricimonas faecihominis]
MVKLEELAKDHYENEELAGEALKYYKMAASGNKGSVDEWVYVFGYEGKVLLRTGQRL